MSYGETFQVEIMSTDCCVETFLFILDSIFAWTFSSHLPIWFMATATAAKPYVNTVLTVFFCFFSFYFQVCTTFSLLVKINCDWRNFSMKNWRSYRQPKGLILKLIFFWGETHLIAVLSFWAIKVTRPCWANIKTFLVFCCWPEGSSMCVKLEMLRCDKS